MLKSDTLLPKISDQFAGLKLAIQNRGLLQRTDLHKSAENFFCEFLSRLHGKPFKNLNHKKVNHPAIDLGQEDMKLGVQITSDNSKDKVQETLDTAMRHRLYKDYGHIQVLILGDKQGRYKKIDVDPKFKFNPADDILDFADLVKMLDKLKTPQLQSLSDFLDQELHKIVGDPPAMTPEAKAHDREQFRKLNLLMSEADLMGAVDKLGSDHSYRERHWNPLDNFVHSFQSEENRFISEELNAAGDAVCGPVDNLLRFISSNFFYYPSNQNDRQCMQPDGNPDRTNYVTPEARARYVQLENQLKHLLEEAEQQYKAFRKKMKSVLLV